jgi:FlaA1/EpsC-like NDP-sugar epimerase
MHRAIIPQTIQSIKTTTSTSAAIIRSCSNTHPSSFKLYYFNASKSLSGLKRKVITLIITLIALSTLSFTDVEAMTMLSSSSHTSTTLRSSRYQSQQTKTCAIVGVGVLGTSLCKQILSSPDFQNVIVTGITKSHDRHELIREQIGFTKVASRLTLITMEELMEKKFTKFDHVIFCAPPSGFENYPDAVKEAVNDIWLGPHDGGVFIFTSSGAV